MAELLLKSAGELLLVERAVLSKFGPGILLLV